MKKKKILKMLIRSQLRFKKKLAQREAAIHASLSLQIITCSAKFESFLKNTVFANGSFLFV